MELTVEERWRMVRERREGPFVYAVKTTGVYCKPSCAARPARRENVLFFDTAGEAEAAGFRACLRCWRSGHGELVADACRYLEASEERVPLETLAARAGMSAGHFHRVFAAETGVTPRAYWAARRAERMRWELGARGSVTEAIYEAGYGSNGRFYAEMDGVLGMTARRYRKGGEDMEIRFAIGESSLRAVLVARSEGGVCAIWLGDDPEALARELQDRFPRAELVGGDAEFEALVARVVGLVERPGLGAELPLDVRGTAFQQRVWEALRRIPAGKTVSYAEVAREIGAPGSVRAVAQACGANVMAVAIPCHRVVRTDGGISGYRWGVERKRELLERER